METIVLEVVKEEVYREVAKATDYIGSKMLDSDENARERILAGDEDLSELGRMWDETALALSERFKGLLQSESISNGRYRAKLEVSRNFEMSLARNVEASIKSFFIASIIAQWFKYTNKGEAADYFAQAGEMLMSAERLLYSRRRPRRPLS